MDEVEAVGDKRAYHGDKKYPEILIRIPQNSNGVLMSDTAPCFISAAPCVMKSVL